MNQEWIDKYEEFQYGDDEQIKLYNIIEKYLWFKEDVVENRERYQSLLNLQKSDLNYWAQMRYRRMIRELLVKYKINLLELSKRQKEILELGLVDEEFLDKENYDKERKSIIKILEGH